MTLTHASIGSSLLTGKVAVIGANSNLGRRIVVALGSDAVPIARSSHPGLYSKSTFVVSDYDNIPPYAFEGCIAAVNCVGTTSGTLEAMARVNGDMCVSAALVAKSYGVLRFVHVSSFSVYGEAERIDGDTIEMPSDAYGISKFQADQALLSITDMDIAVLRLPAIVGQHVPSKLSQLVDMWRKLYILPVAPDAERSMLSVDAGAAAACILARANAPVCGKWLVADPNPVNLLKLARLSETKKRGRLHAVVLPHMITGALRQILPSVFDKLYSSSVLAPEANAFFSLGLTSRLDEEIQRMIEE